MSAIFPLRCSTEAIWVVLIATVALATYLVGALPFVGVLSNGDEINVIETALRLAGGTIEPFGLRHGTGLPLLLALEYGVWYAIQLALGRMHQPLDVVLAYLRDPTVMVLLGRLTAALAGVVVILLTWSLGRRLYSPVVGIMASAFTGLSVLPVTMIVRFKEELPALAALLAGLWYAAALAGFVNSKRRSPVRLAMLAGVWIGIAAAFKYTAGLGLVSAWLAAWWSAPREKGARQSAWKHWARLSLVSALSAGAAFMALTPAVMFHPRLFLSGLHDVAAGYASFSQPMPPILTRVFRQLPDAVGRPMALFAVLGGIAALRRNRRLGMWLLAYPIALLAALGFSVGTASHLIPAVPLLAILAAVGVSAIVPSLVRERRVQGAVLTIMTVAVLSPTYADACRVVAVMQRPDTRIAALAWVRQHVPDGSHVVVEGARYNKIYFAPDLPATRESLEADRAAIRAQGGYGRLAQMRVELAGREPSKPAFRLTKTLTASADLVAQARPDVVITSGYFDRTLFEDEPVDVIDVLPCNKPEIQRERQALAVALANEFTVRATFEPGVRFHEEFPLFYGGDFIRLRRIPVWGDRQHLAQGPVLTIYQRKSDQRR